MPTNPFSSEGPQPGPFLSRMTAKREIVRIVRDEGTPQESSTEVWAHIQETSGFFDPGTLVQEGDVVVAGKRRLLAARVDEHTSGARYLQHVKVKWGTAADLPAPVARTLDVGRLHLAVREAADEALSHGDPGLAVHRAFTALEGRAPDLDPLLRELLSRVRDAERVGPTDSAHALELLALASLLHRTVDHHEG